MNVLKMFSVFMLIFCFSSCADLDKDNIDRTADFTVTEFDYFDDVDNVNTTLWRFNKSDEEASLGRILFYDKLLSLNNSTSCASCHNQAAAFADDKKVSEGLFGELSKRNSSALMNSGFRGRYFWDGRRGNLTDAVLDPIKDHSEMAFDNMESLITRLNQTEYYPRLFKEAFGEDGISEDKIGIALSEFLASIYTFDSKWDEGYDIGFSNYTESERAGLDLFNLYNCSSCHSGRDLDSYYAHANIGLDTDYVDEGTGDGNFRVPSLRNIELTAPYMHDGRYASLEEVIDFYDSGVQSHPNLNWLLQDESGEPIRLDLSEKDKADMLAFLLTLTDESLVYDERFSNPF